MKERNIRTGKAVSILMVLILTFMFVWMPTDVNAQTATARGSLCTNCGIDQLVPHTTYGPWYIYASTPCVHGYRYGNDLKCSRLKSILYKCPNCGEADSTQSTEYKTECQGYN